MYQDRVVVGLALTVLLYSPRRAVVVSPSSCAPQVGAHCYKDLRCRRDLEDFLRLPPLPEGFPGLGAVHRVSLVAFSRRVFVVLQRLRLRTRDCWGYRTHLPLAVSWLCFVSALSRSLWVE